MYTATVAEVGRRPGAILSRKEASIVTNNGHAQNIILNVSGMDIDEVVDLCRTLQGKTALEALRRSSLDRGLNTIAPEDIDTEVASVRSKRA